jgi:RsiW-degrading membrane proteinase PrsW (M82 family)
MAVIGIILNFLVGFAFLAFLVRSREARRNKLGKSRLMDFLPVLLAGTVSIPVTWGLHQLVPEIFYAVYNAERDFGSALLGQILVTGPVEETAKFLTFLLVVSKIRAPRDHFDHLILGALVSLGFALVENISYIAIYGWDVILTRSILSVPGHMVYGFIWSLVYGWLRLDPKVHAVQVIPYTILYGLLPAAFLHGLYNASFWVIDWPTAIMINLGVHITAIFIGLKVRSFSPFHGRGKEFQYLRIQELQQTLSNDPLQHEARRELALSYVRQGELQKAWALIHQDKTWPEDPGLLALSAFLSMRKHQAPKAEGKLQKAFKMDRARVVDLMNNWIWTLNRSHYVRYEMQKWFVQFKRTYPAAQKNQDKNTNLVIKFIFGSLVGLLVTVFTFISLAAYLGELSVLITMFVIASMVICALRSKNLLWRPFYYGIASTVFVIEIITATLS